MASLIRLTRIWYPLLLACLLIQIANALQATASGLVLDASGISATALALVLTAFYAGSATGSLFAAAVIHRLGHTSAFAALAAAGAAGLAVYLSGDHPLLWALARFVFGFGLSAVFVVVESWLNDRSANAVRGRTFALYIAVQLGGLMLGQALVPALIGALSLLFAAASVLMLISSLPVIAGAAPRAARHEPPPYSFWRLVRGSPLGAAGALAAGFTWAVLMALGPVYAQRVGFDTEAVAIFMMAGIAGGIVAQHPAGYVSDHFDRRLVLCGLTFAGALIAVTAALAGGGLALQAILFAALGAALLPIYTISAAHMNDRLAPEERVGASGGIVLLFGIGSVIGPMLTPLVMQGAGPAGFFLVLAALSASLGSFAIYRMRGAAGERSPHAEDRASP